LTAGRVVKHLGAISGSAFGGLERRPVDAGNAPENSLKVPLTIDHAFRDRPRVMGG